MVRLTRQGEFVMHRIALLAVALLAASSAQAQVHKCVDAAGKVIYTQDPCPANTKSGTMSRNVLSAPAAAPADAPADKAAGAAKSTAPKTAAQQEMEFRKRQQEQAKAAKISEQKSAETQAKEQNCRNARERLAQYDIGGRISRINEKGERYYVDDEQRELERSRARADIAQSCN
jgi:hypothetical protein